MRSSSCQAKNVWLVNSTYGQSHGERLKSTYQPCKLSFEAGPPTLLQLVLLPARPQTWLHVSRITPPNPNRFISLARVASLVSTPTLTKHHGSNHCRLCARQHGISAPPRYVCKAMISIPFPSFGVQSNTSDILRRAVSSFFLGWPFSLAIYHLLVHIWGYFSSNSTRYNPHPLPGGVAVAGEKSGSDPAPISFGDTGTAVRTFRVSGLLMNISVAAATVGTFASLLAFNTSNAVTSCGRCLSFSASSQTDYCCPR